MRQRIGLAVALAVVALAAAGSVAGAASRTGATVSLRKTKLGMILVSSKGHSLYLFAKDRNDKSVQRELREVLAAAAGARQADRRRRGQGFAARHDETQ